MFLYTDNFGLFQPMLLVSDTVYHLTSRAQFSIHIAVAKDLNFSGSHVSSTAIYKRKGLLENNHHQIEGRNEALYNLFRLDSDPKILEPVSATVFFVVWSLFIRSNLVADTQYI